MNNEITNLIEQLKETYQGEPWFGRSVEALLNEVDEATAFEKPGGQHSIVELVWHMANWNEFTTYNLQTGNEKIQRYFEENDWRTLDHSDKSLWQQGLHKFHQSYLKLIEVLQQQNDGILKNTIAERTYNFKQLLQGIVHHAIYHVGQVAYINKLVKKQD